MGQLPQAGHARTTGFVLVHGGVHQASAWAPLLPHLRHRALTVDLPGRGGRPADLIQVGIDACVDSICADIDAWDVERVVLVGHSLAGVTVPLVAERLPDRVAHVVLLAALVPPSGKSVFTSLSWLERAFVARFVPPDQPFTLIPPMVKFGFGTHLSSEQWERLQTQICPESSRLLYEIVERRPPPRRSPLTYVVHLRDRMLSVNRQYASIRNLGQPIEVRTIDAGHSAFAARPAEVGALLDEIADG
jgi:pimeloyl-ACP methyl ester carboxylesterase